MLLFILLFLFFVIIPVGIGIVIYKLIVRSGSKRNATIFAVIYGLILTVTAVSIIFEDELFTKGDALELLREQRIELADGFSIVENQSMSGIGDYYHTFTLQISEKDKFKIIEGIKQAHNFIPFVDSAATDFYPTEDRYEEKRTEYNYETEYQYIREYFQGNGQSYAPTHRKIKVQKKTNEIVFEEMVE